MTNAGETTVPPREPPGVGQNELFEQIFQQYYRPVSYFFVRRGCSLEECHDLTQETFLGAYKGIARFRLDESIEKWLFTIALNIWRNRNRARLTEKRNAPEIPLDKIANETSFADFDGSPETNTLTDERLRLLRKAMSDLPPQMRRCISLRINQELKYREIATALDIAVDTVKSLLGQAKQRLRRDLADHFAGFEL